ncbi:tRNA/rRNA methyltransferase [Stella humosa]|uniref:tRNA (cytidine/uridine-2'-O-)-methyltransferase TrmJ n=1 Tax=Stella humosa TaxID=94 RepID=A0A3N1M7H3_9PROT|nr:RNA methyltransferase [Stella humosa]ROP99647.1 tRNA/rRNA methyltransferase [Stella humosa]
MSGTDLARLALSDGEGEPGPIVVLVQPQLAENVGSAARAMLNCGLSRLRLVAPRESRLSERAIAAASGADVVLERAEVFATLEEAIADCHRVYATSARPREMVKRVVTPRLGAAELRQASAAGERVALLFGPERTGLVNDDISLADTILSVPLNPGFSSLNLAQAVLLVCHEWFQAGDQTPAEEISYHGNRPATRGELINFFSRLEIGLEEGGFFQSPDMRPHMMRAIRNAFDRAGLTEQEIRTLHGVIYALRKAPPTPGRPRKGDREGAGDGVSGS